jgi:glutathione S-transferase
MTEIEHPLLSVLMHRRLLPADKRDSQRAARNEGVLRQPFDVLEQALRGRDWLVGNHFGVADLNVASVLGWARAARLPLRDWPALDAWLKRCQARPARKRAQGH